MSPLFLFLKASLPPGARWITVRPHGPGTEGQAVLIQPEASGGGYHVIGGAGGKLNYLKLTGVKSEESYKQEAAQRQASHREEQKRRAKSDREHGLSQSKAAAKEAIRAQVGDQRAKFIDKVSTVLGWKPEAMRFPVEEYGNVSEAARKKAAEKHGHELLRKAVEAVDFQRKRLVIDAEARHQAGLGEVPLTAASPEQISVQDLNPIAPESKGFGYSTDYQKRAEARGATKEDVAEEAAVAKPVTEAKAAAVRDKKAVSEQIAIELQEIRDPGPKVNTALMIDAKKAIELMQAAKELTAVQSKAREKNKMIEGSDTPIEPKAYILETGGPVDNDLVAGLESDLRTLRTRAFLEEIGHIAPGESLGKHVGVGAYNSINALAMAAGGASLVDRSVVDVLGIAGASQVLARRLRADLTAEEFEQTSQAIAAFHVDHYMTLSDESLRSAREWQDMAKEIEIGDAADGSDLAVAQELNAKRRDFTVNAQRVLGVSLGEMEANAALAVAMQQPSKKQVQVSLGKTSVTSAINQARAIGLDKGDYEVTQAGTNTMLSVHEAGLDKLAMPVSKADLKATREALDIIEGRRDEDNWLPEGVADRPDLAMNIKPGTAPQLAKPFKVGAGGVEQAVGDYIGGRTADGDAPADIISGLLSENIMQASGDRDGFIAAVNKIAPLYDAKGKMVRVETHSDAFNHLADSFVERTYGADRTPLQKQNFPVDDVAVDALHRALAAHPEGVAAFKQAGELTPQDQGALRAAFAKQYGRSDPKAESLRVKVEELDKQQPAKESEGLFGRGVNPEWTSWKAERDTAATAANAAIMDWGKYVAVMGSPTAAYSAMQDVVKSDVLKGFADAHNRLRPKSPLAVGRQVIAHDINHLDALDPVAREKRLETQRGLVDSLRNRVGGKYASGSVADKQEAARAADVAAGQAQMGMFGEPEPEPTKEAPARPLDLGERHTLGNAAERQIAGMMSVAGKDFRPGQPIKLWRPTMSGAYVGRQRAVKLIEHNKRTMLGMGVGSGKTSIMLSALTHLKAKGKAHRGMFLVPSIVQGQFHGEALTMLKPGQFNWHADPGANREQRIAAYKDPKMDFSVVTHQAFRDDLLHLASQQDGVTPAEVATKLDAMPPAERKAYIGAVMKKEGMDFDYLAVDEGHNLLNRAGKANSHLANVVDSVSANAPYYVNSTADPVKNDASEAADILAKLNPERYQDRDAFMRKYGVNTEASKDGLRREMARNFYTGKIDPGVKADKQTISVDVSGQGDQIKALSDAAAAARLARMQGNVDVGAMRTLSPNSFKDVPEAQHEEVAKGLQKNLGIIHNTAMMHAINDGAKTEALAKVAMENKGKAGVVFIHSLDRVKEAAARLQKDGHRVVTLTGGDSSQEKDKKKRDYQAGKYDILVASDAGAVGANLQHGKWLAQYDTPATAMLHAQRNGRIHRIGQTEDVKLIDLVADHPAERRARDRLERKYGLREVMTSALDGLDDTGLAGYLQQARAGTLEAKSSAFMPAGEGETPEGLAPPDEQQSMF